MEEKRLAPLSAEFSTAALGDARLTARLMRISDQLAAAPGAGFPEQAGSAVELEGLYRFLANENVTPEAVLDAHVRCSVARASAFPEVLVVHDTTEFEFGGTEQREGLGWLNYEKRQGLLGHFSIAVTPAGEPLGTVGMYLWSRHGKPKGRRSQSVAQADPDRESLRWQESALLTGELLFNKTQPIHVMDREGDSMELFGMLVDHGQRFVIRLSHNRRLSAGREEQSTKLFEALSQAPYFFDREVPTSPRAKRSGTKLPAREARVAHLEVRAQSMDIHPGNGSCAHLPEKLTLQFIEVRETNPPDGEEPILWRLVTTEPVETEAQVATVIDHYCRRWIIEEFFKALKTGCRFQQRQLETAHGLLTDLAIETAVAWRLLLLRWLSRAAADAPASRALSPSQFAALRALMKSKKRHLSADATVQDALFAVASLGGHLKNNGPPGWLTMRRGFDKLHTAEQMWFAMQETDTGGDVIND